MNSAGCCPCQAYLSPSRSAPKLSLPTLAVQTDLQGRNRSLPNRGGSMDPISAPSFEPAQASPTLTFGPAASTEPAATSPEITCRSDTRAGSIHLLPQASVKR